MFGKVEIRSFEKGLLFKRGEFVRVLDAGVYRFPNPFARVRVDVVSQRTPWLFHEELDLIVRSGALGAAATVVDLKDQERALVWIDGRFDRVLGPGLYALWTGVRQVRVETVLAGGVLFAHPDLSVILKTAEAGKVLDCFCVEEGCLAALYKDGECLRVLEPGQYAAWKDVGNVKVHYVDVREKVLDVPGQEIMTADKVSLRLNALVTYRVTDARLSVERVRDVEQALYREAQLGLRGVIGTRELDALLADKHAVSGELEDAMRQRARDFGVQVLSLGFKDVILPGDMKTLLNKVIEAKKASEANVIARREETAAMRSQMNTAKLMEDNPALMRLRELEVLERVAQNSKLNVVLGEKGLADRVVNLL